MVFFVDALVSRFVIGDLKADRELGEFGKGVDGACINPFHDDPHERAIDAVNHQLRCGCVYVNPLGEKLALFVKGFSVNKDFLIVGANEGDSLIVEDTGRIRMWSKCEREERRIYVGNCG